jgi:hypothetical protein
MKKLLITTTALVALCAHAKAETLNVTQDRVLVSHGKSFHQTHGSSIIRAGDLVKVEKTGKAQLVFSGGCAVELPVGVTRIVDQPCETPLAAGDVTSVSDINPLYVIGALAVAGGIGGGIAAATSGNGGGNDNGAATALAIAAAQRKVSR